MPGFYRTPCLQPKLTHRSDKHALGAAVKPDRSVVADCVATTGTALGMAQGWHRRVSTTAPYTWQRWHQLERWVRAVQVRAALQGYLAPHEARRAGDNLMVTVRDLPICPKPVTQGTEPRRRLSMAANPIRTRRVGRPFQLARCGETRDDDGTTVTGYAAPTYRSQAEPCGGSRR